MSVGQVIKDALDRNERYMLAAIDGLSPEDLRARPAAESNPIGWLMWHLTRVQDYAVSTITEKETLWVRDGWHERFGMAPDPAYRGNGDTNEQVDAFAAPDVETLAAYYKAVRANTDAFLDSLTDADLTRMVPAGAWNGPRPLIRTAAWASSSNRFTTEAKSPTPGALSKARAGWKAKAGPPPAAPQSHLLAP